MSFPLLLEAPQLRDALSSPTLRIIDLSKQETYLQSHIHGAVHLEYPQIIAVEKPIMGLLPDKPTLQNVMQSVGITPDTQVVAYDDEGGGRAARLLWTLATMGHHKMSLLNGGLHVWANEGYPLESGNVTVTPAASRYEFELNPNPIASREYILENLDNPNVAILDTRSTEEFNGAKKFAERAGHIPGAVNLDWLLLMDQSRNLRLKKPEELRLMLGSLEVTADKEVIVYCQTHHRSALTYIALKFLGYQHVRGYPGSWSDWGNRSDTPIEV